jgi:hypothetical protein
MTAIMTRRTVLITSLHRQAGACGTQVVTMRIQLANPYPGANHIVVCESVAMSSR